MACRSGRASDWAVRIRRDWRGLGWDGLSRRAQEHREAKKRRSDKFEELVAAVYEFDHWVEGVRQRETVGVDIPETVSPFAKVEAISSIYFRNSMD